MDRVQQILQIEVQSISSLLTTFNKFSPGLPFIVGIHSKVGVLQALSISLIDNFADYLWALLGTVLDNLSQNSCTHFIFSYIVQSIGIYPKS